MERRERSFDEIVREVYGKRLRNFKLIDSQRVAGIDLLPFCLDTQEGLLAMDNPVLEGRPSRAGHIAHYMLVHLRIPLADVMAAYVPTFMSMVLRLFYYALVPWVRLYGMKRSLAEIQGHILDAMDEAPVLDVKEGAASGPKSKYDIPSSAEMIVFIMKHTNFTEKELMRMYVAHIYIYFKAVLKSEIGVLEYNKTLTHEIDRLNKENKKLKNAAKENKEV